MRIRLAPAPPPGCVGGAGAVGDGAKVKRVLFSSLSPHWATPKAVYDALDAEFHFTLDPCHLHETDWRDGSARSWKGERVYCNPPYGAVAKWLMKAREAEAAVFLLPARTDTKWWHEYAMQADEIRFIRGRLKFGGAKFNAPFPSVVLIYGRIP